MSRIRTWLNGLAALVFPSFCLHCRSTIPDRVGARLCDQCLSGVRMPDGGTCRTCGQFLGPSARSKSACANCQDRSFSFQRVHALGRYTPPLKRWIHMMKFLNKPVIGHTLGVKLGTLLHRTPLEPAPDLITGIPLTPYREARRQFNQAYLIATGVKEVLDIPFEPDLLVKSRRTTPQVQLSRHERLNNLPSDTFRVPDTAPVDGRHVLLVDDVLTTGSTLDVAGRALLDGGADSVRGGVLAR